MNNFKIFQSMEFVLKDQILKEVINFLKFEVELKVNKNFNEKIFRITPNNLKAANMAINVLDNWNGINLWIGKFIIIEFFPQEKDMIGDFKKFCQAVIQGRVVEELWYKDSKIIKSIGIIDIDGEKFKMHHSLAFHNFFRKSECKIIQYEPYK